MAIFLKFAYENYISIIEILKYHKSNIKELFDKRFKLKNLTHFDLIYYLIKFYNSNLCLDMSLLDYLNWEDLR